MFETLIESRPSRRRGLPEHALSFALHAVLAAGAVALTTTTTAALRPAPPPVVQPLVFPDPGTAHGAAGGTGVLPAAPRPALDIPLPPVPVLPDRPEVRDPQTLWPMPAASDGAGPLLAAALGPDSAGIADVAPALLEAPVPEYPAALRAAGVEGRVILEFTVTSEGRALEGSHRVIESPHPGLVAPAIQAIGASRFRPAQFRGARVPARVRQAVWFRLQPARPPA